MSKKDKKRRETLSQPDAATEQPVTSTRGWKLIGIGIGIVVLGFIVLCFTDPRGQNFASKLSPFLIIGGYTLIGFGIVQKDPIP